MFSLAACDPGFWNPRAEEGSLINNGDVYMYEMLKAGTRMTE